MEYQRVTRYITANLEKVGTRAALKGIALPAFHHAFQIDFPFIVFHSENDTMIDIDGSKALLARASVRAI